MTPRTGTGCSQVSGATAATRRILGACTTPRRGSMQEAGLAHRPAGLGIPALRAQIPGQARGLSATLHQSKSTSPASGGVPGMLIGFAQTIELLAEFSVGHAGG